jgi:tetratricopeptide (TPR) repeat protein
MKNKRPAKESKRPGAVAEASIPDPLSPNSFLSSSKKQSVFIFVLACILYVNTLGFDFNLDDGVVITGNKFTTQGFKGIPEILSHDSFYGYFGNSDFLDEGRYRPLTQVLFAIGYQFFGLNAFAGHLLNILMYAFSCVFLLYILSRIFDKHPGAYLSIPFIAALIYTAHPIHTEVVANIKGLDEIMSFLFSLFCLHFSMNYTETKKLRDLVLVFFMFFLAMLSKENAVTFLAIIPLVFYFFRNASAKDYVMVLLPMILAFTAYMLMRYNALGFIVGKSVKPELLNDPFLEASKAEKYATIFYTWGKYLYLLIFPHPLTHDYYPKQIPILGWGDIRVILSFLFFAAAAVLSIVLLKRRSIVSFAILFFFCTFSVSSNLIVPVGTFMNERFMYVASLGYSIIIAWLLADKLPALFRDFGKYRLVLNTLLLVITILFAVKAISRNFAWKDGYTLFTTDVKVSDNSAKCNTSAGGMMMEKAFTITEPSSKKQLLDDAVVYMEKAVRIHPLSANAWLILGRAKIELGDLAYAEMATYNCLKIIPTQPDAQNNMLYIAQQYTKSGAFDAAARTYRELMTVRKDQGDLSYALAMVYESKGETDKSIRILDSLGNLQPPYLPALAKLGEMYGKKLNDLDRSLGYYLKYYASNKKDIVVLENLGVIYGMKGMFAESVRYLEEAILLQPDNAGLYRNIATSYRSLGNIEKYNEAMKKLETIK